MSYFRPNMTRAMSSRVSGLLPAVPAATHVHVRAGPRRAPAPRAAASPCAARAVGSVLRLQPLPQPVAAQRRPTRRTYPGRAAPSAMSRGCARGGACSVAGSPRCTAPVACTARASIAAPSACAQDHEIRDGIDADGMTPLCGERPCCLHGTRRGLSARANAALGVRHIGVRHDSALRARVDPGVVCHRHGQARRDHHAGVAAQGLTNGLVLQQAEETASLVSAARGTGAGTRLGGSGRAVPGSSERPSTVRAAGSIATAGSVRPLQAARGRASSTPAHVTHPRCARRRAGRPRSAARGASADARRQNGAPWSPHCPPQRASAGARSPARRACPRRRRRQGRAVQPRAPAGAHSRRR